MKRKKTPEMVTVNRKARYDYTLGDELTAGMALAGPEVRAIRDHHVQLKGAFVTIRAGELWLNNLTLGAETARNIKLLATRKQIAALEREKVAGATPTLINNYTYNIFRLTFNKDVVRFFKLAPISLVYT